MTSARSNRIKLIKENNTRLSCLSPKREKKGAILIFLLKFHSQIELLRNIEDNCFLLQRTVVFNDRIENLLSVELKRFRKLDCNRITAHFYDILCTHIIISKCSTVILTYMKVLKSNHCRWVPGLQTANKKTAHGKLRSKGYVGYVGISEHWGPVRARLWKRTTGTEDFNTKFNMILDIECALLLGVQKTVLWNHLKGIQDVFSKVILCCEPMHCSWRGLRVQLQKHILNWSQNVQFFNSDGQVEPTKIHPSGSAQLIISDAFMIWCLISPQTTELLIHASTSTIYW